MRSERAQLIAEFGENRTQEERNLRLHLYNQLPKSWKDLMGKPYSLKYDWKKQEWIKVYHYSHNYTYVRRDNMNPRTEKLPGFWPTYDSKMRVPSKKHKNRYKNFLKLFPNYGKCRDDMHLKK